MYECTFLKAMIQLSISRKFDCTELPWNRDEALLGRQKAGIELSQDVQGISRIEKDMRRADIAMVLGANRRDSDSTP